ncbi:MAG: hypothetical protein HUK15_01850, partial [Bacteroidales bacterium]|nr:hypothetical protein [Bacteroidales bacterium]
MRKVGFIILLALLCNIAAFGQKKAKGKSDYKYNIEFTIKGIQDTVVYVGHHLGEKKYVIDTISIDSKGYGVMRGNKEIHKGIYIVVMPSIGMKFFEFLMGPENERFFSIETDTVNFVENMKVTGSQQNVEFNKYQLKMYDLQKERFEIEKALKTAGDNKELRDAEYE